MNRGRPFRRGRGRSFVPNRSHAEQFVVPQLNHFPPPPVFSLPPPLNFNGPPPSFGGPHYTQPRPQFKNTGNFQHPKQWGNQKHENTIITQNNGKQTKKRNVYKLKPPSPFNCDTCDKPFKTDVALQLHVKEHTTCGRDGCLFTAHPKVVAKHVQMQHDTGLYNRIGNLYSEDELAKWIEARRKYYPSKKTIEDKKILQEEKSTRGERLKENKERFNKDFIRKNKGNNRSKKQRKNRKLNQENKSRPLLEVEIEAEEREKWRGNIPAFQGLGALGSELAQLPSEPEEEGNHIGEISDDEWNGKETLGPKIATPLMSKALGLLASCYGSDIEDSDVEEPKSVPHDPIPVVVPDKALNQEPVSSEDEDNAPNEVKTIKTTVNDEQVEVKIKTEDGHKRKRNHNRGKYSATNRAKIQKIDDCKDEKVLEKSYDRCRETQTLLAKLLSKEILHERNVILQCVRHVVNNNFYLENKNCIV